MRICLVSETWSPDINGVAHTLSHISRELAARNITLQLVRPRPDDGSQAEEITDELQVKGVHLPGYQVVKLGLPAGSTLRRLWQTRRPDVVYIATEGPLGWSALRQARRLGLPVASGFHTNFDHYVGDYGLGWLKGTVSAVLRHFHNRTDATLVPTASQARMLTAQGFANVKVMSRGIDARHFSPGKRDPALRRSWGAGEHQPVALHVGRLASEKNLDLLVDSVQAMQRAQPDLITVLVGDGPLRESLQRRLPDAIFTGFVNRETLARHYASADLFVFPSCSETYGNVVAEAMASGLGVVAFDHAAASELIVSGRQGLTAPVGDNDTFIEHATTLCQHPARYGQLGRQARARVADQSWDRIADDFLHILRSLQEISDDATHACRL
ncbi:glycosyltransferase family 1 protein [Halomonas sp. YLGW01]|uniref:glycosyltransferase family 4 protein n=1 Tax=Halomonas sp. YLGW01 TaxID=2773308 RepID=UPI00177B931B|nr:glycosyltransferase family 1 protein [Halomonas sp. YLGW01]